jgi:hypothetical protein
VGGPDDELTDAIFERAAVQSDFGCYPQTTQRSTAIFCKHSLAFIP